MLQEHPETHFCNKSKTKMFRLLESFDRQNRLGLKESQLNSYKVGHFRQQKGVSQ